MPCGSAGIRRGDSGIRGNCRGVPCRCASRPSSMGSLSIPRSCLSVRSSHGRSRVIGLAVSARWLTRMSAGCLSRTVGHRLGRINRRRCPGIVRPRIVRPRCRPVGSRRSAGLRWRCRRATSVCRSRASSMGRGRATGMCRDRAGVGWHCRRTTMGTAAMGTATMSHRGTCRCRGRCCRRALPMHPRHCHCRGRGIRNRCGCRRRWRRPAATEGRTSRQTRCPTPNRLSLLHRDVAHALVPLKVF